jgi:hypothetical protein
LHPAGDQDKNPHHNPKKRKGFHDLRLTFLNPA